MRIDAHQHFWAIARGDYGWLTPDMPGLYRDFLPPDLQIHLNRHALDGTILVQAAPTVAETEFLLALSERTETVCGVVGWIDLENSTCLQEFERFSRHPKFLGFRVMIQDMKDPTRILQQGVIARLFEFADRKVPIDLLVKYHRANAICPGIIETPMLENSIQLAPDPEEFRRWNELAQPMGRLGTPLECAYAALFLCSDESSFITGVALPVDGGFTAV